MTLSDRDRRILLILLPVVVLIAWWFLLMSPKRADLNTAKDEQTQAEQARDQAVAQASQLQKAKSTFAADYADVIRLGKAIPATVDAPSLLVQLDRASKGTHIDFNSVTIGQRAPATVPTATTTSTQGATQPNGNAAAGGAPAATGQGQAAESAGNAVSTANQTSSAAESASGTSSTTSTTTATAAPASAAPATTTTSLDSVPLTFNFTGTYFDLADFFHRLKRFVYPLNNQVVVRGRLLTIDTLSFSLTGGTATGTTSSNAHDLTATVGATVYLSPLGQGVAGGATPAGPAGTSTTTTTTAPTGSETSRVPLAVGTR